MKTERYRQRRRRAPALLAEGSLSIKHHPRLTTAEDPAQSIHEIMTVA
jgi:hypothetical protein